MPAMSTESRRTSEVAAHGVTVQALAVKVGLILPNDDIAAIAAEATRGLVQDGDILCVTEAVVARSQNRYLTCDELAEDIIRKFDLSPGATLAVLYPIASRNRFALVLRAIAQATRGGRVIVAFPIPADEVGNQVIDAEFARVRLSLKGVYRHFADARGSTPHLNLLIREVIAALLLQSMGYTIVGMRKIFGTGIADITVRTPDGVLAPVEVTFTDLTKAAKQAVGLMGDIPEARRALAAGVDFGRGTFVLYDAVEFLAGTGEPLVRTSFAQLLDVFRDDSVIYANELPEGFFRHPITGVDYRSFYLETIAAGGAQGDAIFTNNPFKVYELGYLDGVVIGEVHTRQMRREMFQAFGAQVPVRTLDELGPPPWGVIGSNVSDYEGCLLKLLPENADATAEAIRTRVRETSGVDVEVVIFGDGAYKDPDTGIYELADPYPAIGATSGLKNGRLRTGKKLKLAVDTLSRKGHTREEIEEILQASEADEREVGTTPRRIVAIAATIADLIAGSADQATPIVVLKGFFGG